MENDETPRRQHMWKVSALGWQWLSDPDIYSKELKTNICTDICTWLFISAHMGIYSSCIDNTRTCEQPKCPWVSGWTHKHHTMAVFSALKMHALSCLGETLRNLKHTSLNEQSHLKRLHAFSTWHSGEHKGTTETVKPLIVGKSSGCERGEKL